MARHGVKPWGADALVAGEPGVPPVHAHDVRHSFGQRGRHPSRPGVSRLREVRVDIDHPDAIEQVSHGGLLPLEPNASSQLAALSARCSVGRASQPEDGVATVLLWHRP